MATFIIQYEKFKSRLRHFFYLHITGILPRINQWGSSCTSLRSLSSSYVAIGAGFGTILLGSRLQSILALPLWGISASLACIAVCMQSGYAIVPHLLDGCGNIPCCGFCAMGINLTNPALNPEYYF